MKAVNFRVRRWHAWSPGRAEVAAWRAWQTGGLQDAATDNVVAPVEFVEPMLRRRLSPLSRVALHCCHRVLAEERPSQLVFASRHGELGTTVQLLRQLAAAEPMSPMGFSLSVHNTAAGLYGIAANDSAPATAIAAGRETLPSALLEAEALLAAGAETVLLSYVEQDLPAPYQSWQEAEEPLLGLAMLLDRKSVQQVSLTGSDNKKKAPYRSPGLAMINTLLDGRASGFPGEQLQWSMAGV